ncbi:hypothetical protein ACFXHL_48910, partial [Streptomyces mirabilis]
VTQDLLTDTEGLAVWLAANGLDFPADDTVLLQDRRADEEQDRRLCLPVHSSTSVLPRPGGCDRY